MNLSTARITIRGTSAYSQSKKHDTDKLDKKESAHAYEERTWRERAHIRTIDGKPTRVIPAHGFMQAIQSAAKYLNRKIPGERNSTWTKHFRAGIAILEDISLGLSPDVIRKQAISAHSTGVRGSGSRVTRYMPQIDLGWKATFDVIILDSLITDDIFREVLETAGLFVGIGQFRPENGGTNGRFEIVKFEWFDNRMGLAA